MGVWAVVRQAPTLLVLDNARGPRSAHICKGSHISLGNRIAGFTDLALRKFHSPSNLNERWLIFIKHLLRAEVLG